MGCANRLLILREATVSRKISRKHFIAQFVCFSCIFSDELSHLISRERLLVKNPSVQQRLSNKCPPSHFINACNLAHLALANYHAETCTHVSTRFRFKGISVSPDFSPLPGHPWCCASRWWKLKEQKYIMNVYRPTTAWVI